MKPVLEIKLTQPIEVAWDSEAPMPRITLRRPDMVTYDPVDRMVHVDTGRGVKTFSVDSGLVDRMAVGLGETAEDAATPTPSPSKASPSVASLPSEPKAPLPPGVLRRPKR